MKKLLFLVFALICSLSSYSQGMATSGSQFPTRTELRKQSGQNKVMVTLSGLITEGDKNGGIYQWDETSILVDDGVSVIKVDNVPTGRWIKKLNENTIKGSVTFSGVTLQTSYNVTFTNPLPFIPAMVFTEATSPNAAVLRYITNKSTTGFTVNFLTVPVLGTANISFDYLVIKQ